MFCKYILLTRASIIFYCMEAYQDLLSLSIRLFIAFVEVCTSAASAAQFRLMNEPKFSI